MIVFALLILSFLIGNIYKFSFFSPDLRISLLDLSLVLITAVTFICRPGRFLHKPVFVFAGIALLSLFFSLPVFGPKAFVVGFAYLARWLIYSLSFISFSHLLSPHRIKQLLFCLGLVIVVTGLVQYTFLPDLRFTAAANWDPHYFRVVGPLLDPGFVGMLLVLFIIFLSTLPVGSGLANRLVWPFAFTALMLTYSRSSYLAFFVALLPIAVIKKSAKLFAATLLVFMLALAFLPRPGGEGTNLDRSNSVQLRFINWGQSLRIFADHPVIGVGFNVYRYAQNRYGFLDSTNWLSSHAGAGADASLLFVAATTGLIGLVAFLYYLSSLFFHHSPLVTFSLLALLAHSLFLNSLFYPPIMLWLALLAALEVPKAQT